jgi:hypothetical protein
LIYKRRVNNYPGAANGDAIGIVQVVRIVDVQFKVFKVFGLLILKQRYINKFFALSSLETKARFLLGLKVFSANSCLINGFVGEDERFLHRLPQLYRKADNTFIFICGNAGNFDCPVQRLRHYGRSIGISVIVDVHPVEAEHQLGGTGNIGRQYCGSRFQGIENGDRRPLNLRPANQPDRHAGGALHLAVQHHQQIGVRELQAARIHQNTVVRLITRFKTADFVIVNQLVQLADGGVVRLLTRCMDF